MRAVTTVQHDAGSNSENKRVEEERQQLVSFLEAIFNEVYVFDTGSLRFRYANHSALENLGYTSDQLRLLTPLDLCQEFTEESYRRIVKPLLEGTAARRVFQAFHRRADGTDYPVEICLQALSTFGERVFLAVINDITERRRAEAKLAEAHLKLLESTRLAGMAEVATGMLHNIGNVLNSVNVSATLLREQAQKTPGPDLLRVVALLQAQGANLGAFFTNDPRGLKVPEFLSNLADKFSRQQESQLGEIASLQKNIEHIKAIVTMQQSYARVSGATEIVPVIELLEDALRMNSGASSRNTTQLVREFAAGLPALTIEKQKVLQILVNLLRNAKHACDDSDRLDKRITVRASHGAGRVRMQVIDNGVGIPPQNLASIFGHGFTTKKDGHGFGLHSAALAAKELGGSLQVRSDGLGHGATFTLELPVAHRGTEFGMSAGRSNDRTVLNPPPENVNPGLRP